LPQVFLELVGDGQRLIEPQRFPESIQVVSVLVEVFGILDHEPTGALEDAAVMIAGGLVEQLTADGA